jgi:ferrous iron transport protein B
MASCCDIDPGKIKAGTLVVALAGNPNSGKTTVFNALTGLRQKVANYPGVTVEKKTGTSKLPGGITATIIDLPGTYSLISRSPDEQVAMEVLRGLRSDVPPPDAVVVVVDASNLQRNLYLVSQLIELGRPLVVALNMMDIAERRGLRISPERLSQQLKVPVVPVVGYKRKGIDELKAAILEARVAPLPDWQLPEAMKEELLVVGGGLAILDSENEVGFGKELGENAPPRAWICREGSARKLDRYEAIAERLLVGDRSAGLEKFATKQPVRSLLESAASRLSNQGIDPMQADIEAHYQWIDTVAAGSLAPACEDLSTLRTTGYQPVSSNEERHGLVARGTNAPLNYAPKPTLTERADRILIHKIWGVLIFAVIMATIFICMFWLAQPVMDAIGHGIDWLGAFVGAHLPEGPIHDMIVDGIFKGVGTVITFVPQIAILFFFLSVLEDSGYLARAAFIMDRLLSKVGLHGKSFIPLLSSFACAIPGIMATRTIENRRERLATILVAPFMSCSARLPVYGLLIGTLFATSSAVTQALIMLALYALGIVAAAGTAWAFKRSMNKGPATTFILELPTYKIPQMSEVGRQVYKNTAAFLTKAGTTILALSIVMWALAYYPRMPDARIAQVRHVATVEAIKSTYRAYREKDPTPTELFLRGQAVVLGEYEKAKSPEWGTKEADDFADAVHLTIEQKQSISDELNNKLAAAQSEYSFAGRFGHAIEPGIRPLGYDWKMGVGLVGAFAAREMFVGTMGIVYAVGQVEDDTKGLSDAMQADHYANGKPVWTKLTAISMLVWFVLAMQCMSTVAIVKRETGGWRWPIFQLVYMNVVAYVASLIVYQVGVHLL